MISDLARSTTPPLVCLLVMGGAAGCSILFPFQPDRDAAPGVELDAAADASVDSGPDSAVDASVDAGTDAGCDPEHCAEGLRTCLALRAQCPCANSGARVLDPDGDGPGLPIEAYCDMDIAGGGWTLVGRSVADREPDVFGWGTNRGTVAKVAEPYSLDVLSRSIAATALLVGSHRDGMVWGPNVYEITLPPDFLSSHGDSAASTDVHWVAGACAPETSPRMLGQMGFTSWTGGFYFRDIESETLQPSGLQQGGWNLGEAGESTCDRSGLLDDLPGMLFVR